MVNLYDRDAVSCRRVPRARIGNWVSQDCALNETVCNPLSFGSRNGQAFRVRTGPATTQACNTAANRGDTRSLWQALPQGMSEQDLQGTWEAYRDAFQSICSVGETDSRGYIKTGFHCIECAVIARRLRQFRAAASPEVPPVCGPARASGTGQNVRSDATGTDSATAQ